MADTIVLRTTKIGNGFVKEDVLQYLDGLKTTIDRLTAENESLKSEKSENVPSDFSDNLSDENNVLTIENVRLKSENTVLTSENAMLKSQVESLQEKLNKANNSCKIVKNKLYDAKEVIASLQAGENVPAEVCEYPEDENDFSGCTLIQKIPVSDDTLNVNFSKHDILRFMETISSNVKFMQEFMEKYLQC